MIDNDADKPPPGYQPNGMPADWNQETSPVPYTVEDTKRQDERRYSKGAPSSRQEVGYTRMKARPGGFRRR